MEDLLAALLSIDLAPDVIEIPFFTDEPKYPSYFYPKPVSGSYVEGLPYGMSLAREKVGAQAKALAEFYERLCLLNPRPSVPSASWREPAWVDPAAIPAEVDSERADILRQSPYAWLDAIEINSGRKTKIPAQAVVPGFGSDEERILPAVGPSGASLGRAGKPGRVARGLFEVLERHTSSVVPFAERIAQRVVELPAALQEVEADLRRYRLEPYVFWLQARYSTPWVLVALADHSGVGPALSFATRAAETFEDAIATALIESLERRRPARMEEADRQPGSDAPRLYPWEPLETLDRIEPKFNSAALTRFDDLPQTPRTAQDLLACFAADGLDVLSVDTTLPEVAAAGFETSKIVIPSLGPLPV